MFEFIIYLSIPLLFSAFFSAAETACTALSDLQLNIIKTKYPVRGKLIHSLYKSPSLLIGTILVGNNASNLIFSAVATNFTLQLFGNWALSITTGIAIFVILIFGEITPKQLALQYAQQFVLLFTLPLYGFYFLLAPIALLLSQVSNVIKGIFPKEANSLSGLSRIHFIKLFYLARANGVLDSDNANHIARVLQMSELTIDQIYTHRKEIISISSKKTVGETKAILKDVSFRYIPIYKIDDKEHIVGILHTPSVLHYKNNSEIITNLMVPSIFISENKTIKEVLDILKKSNSRIVIILDEYGGLKGLVTMNDIVNYVFDVEAEGDSSVENKAFVKLNPTQYLIDGTVEITTIAEQVGLPLESSIESRTVGGYLQELIGELPIAQQEILTPFGKMQISKISHSRITAIIWTPNPNEKS